MLVELLISQGMDVVETCGKETLSSREPSNKRSIPLIDDDEVVGFENDAEIIMKKLTGRTKELDVLSIFGMPGLGKTTLARKVYNFGQESKRYLIVLDDIWEVEAWKDLRLCFPRSESGCRVMVTTRIEQVAKHLQHCSDPYSLSFLTMEESWVLLQKKVFRGESCPSNLVRVGLQIAQHCKGLPLVVILIAGIIAKIGREASLWLEVANDLSSLALEEQSMKVIQSSYDHLENHLKHCLLYMGLFPENHKIAVDDLLKLWMVEEFVLNVETENMEETSRNCLNDLLNRSLVMVSQKKINGDIEMCLLLDVVREFCLIKLKEEKFMQLTVPYSPYQHICSMDSWLCVYIHDDLVKQLDHYDYQFDKIIFLESKYKVSNPIPLLVKLRVVRVLHFPYEDLPSSWPIAISHLLDLQTVVVHSSKLRRTSPATIWKMKKLRHLNVNKLYLVWDDNDKAIFEKTSTTMLKNLKTFHSHLIYVDDMNPRFWWRFANLENSASVLKLYLVAFVHWQLFLNERNDLNIARLKKLQSLTLERGFPLRIIKHNCWEVTNVEFPSLKYLALHFVRMEEWEASEESFLVLEVLSIRNGYFYKEIPPSFTDIPTMRLIKLYDYTDCLGVSPMNIKKKNQRKHRISVNIEEVDVCKCGYYCRLKTSRTPLNPGRQFFGCKASKENGGCGYFRWIDPSLENADESSLMNRFIDGQNLIDRLKRKVKELEEERDSLKFQLNENEEKIMVLNKKLKEVKLQRDWENVKFNRVVI
ncbi:hypothetical protein H5410_033164, partial [Solanum commersonii]